MYTFLIVPIIQIMCCPICFIWTLKLTLLFRFFPGGGKGNYWREHHGSSTMFDHGTYQRRKKRFKVPSEKEPKQQTVISPEDRYHQTHYTYMQQQLKEQENFMKLRANSNSDSENESEQKQNRQLLAFSIENIMRPDSPKRKKKYSSAEKTLSPQIKKEKKKLVARALSNSPDGSSSGYSSSSPDLVDPSNLLWHPNPTNAYTNAYPLIPPMASLPTPMMPMLPSLQMLPQMLSGSSPLCPPNLYSYPYSMPYLNFPRNMYGSSIMNTLS